MSRQAIVTIKDKQWQAYLATTYAELTTGLRGLPSISPDTGMLFVLPENQVVAVTTQGLLFPIDIVFIANNTVIDVASNIQPEYEVTEETPCDMFLEVNDGDAQGIESGDDVSIVIAQQSGFDWSSITSFAIPLVLLGFVSGMVGGLARLMIGGSDPRYYRLAPGATGLDVVRLEKTSPKKRLYDVFSVIREQSGLSAAEIQLWLETERPTELQIVKEALFILESEGLIEAIPESELREIREAVRHGSYIIVTNLDTGETKQYYNVNPPDSPEVASAILFLKPLLEERWGRNLRFEVKPAAEPKGTCYQDAWRFLIKEEEGHLVHGTVFSQGKRIKHAWVETETGYIWDPQTGKYYTTRGFNDAAAPEVEHRYNAEEAAIMAARTNNFGPWTDEERRQFLEKKTHHSIPSDELKRIADKYGWWAAKLAEAVCPHNDVACTEREAKRLTEARLAR